MAARPGASATHWSTSGVADPPRGRGRAWLLVLLAWEAVALVRTLLWWSLRPTWARLLRAGLLYSLGAVFWTAVSYGVVRLTGRLARRRRWRHWSAPLAAHTAAALVTACAEAVWWRASVATLTAFREPGSLWYTALNHLDSNLVAYAAITGIAYAVRHYARLARAAAHTARLEAQYSETRLHVLTMQLQPHFLFNTLHVISELVHQRPEDARRVSARLRDLLRAAFGPQEAAEVALSDELRSAQAYLEIQRVRYGGRLQVICDVPDAVARAVVPRLVLQPLVENAIRHGTDRALGPGRIEITARRDGEDLELRVKDTGPGPATGAATRGGIGLSNTRARLEQLYGARQSFVLQAGSGGGAEAVIRLPWHTAPPAPTSTTEPPPEDVADLPGAPGRGRPGPAWTIIGIWTLVGVFWGQQEYLLRVWSGSERALGASIFHNVLAAWLWLPLTPALLAVARRRPAAGGWPAAIAAYGALAIAVAALVVMVRRWTGLAAAGPLLGPGTTYAFIWSFCAALAIVGIGVGSGLAAQARTRAAERAALEAELALERLDLVRWRLQPAFVLPVLEAIEAAAATDADRADRLAVAMGDFLRLVLQQNGGRWSTVEREAELARATLGLSVELGRLAAVPPVEIAAQVAAHPVPAWSLQPLIQQVLERSAAGGAPPTRIRAMALGDGVRVTAEATGIELRLP
jgi:two-component system, LytTR family, sensor kinase